MNTRKIQNWLPLLLGLTLAAGMAGGFQLQRHMAWRNRSGSPAGNSAVQQVLDLIEYKYVDSTRLDSTEWDALNAITSNLDPHSIIIPRSEMEDVQADITGNFGGIGVEYQMIRDTLFVVNIIENGPAATSGIQAGDAIIAVDGKSITGKNMKDNDLRGLLRGKRGSTVNIDLMRNSNLSKITITRGEIPLATVDAGYMIAPGIGYIKLNRFAETTYFEFMDAATKLTKAGMKKLVIDLRGNGGGLLDEATKIADELLEDGLTIVSTSGAKVKSQKVIATKPGIFETGPLAVIIDEQSASASEVLAGALQDHDRATIIGARSFGKGLVQEQFQLANGSALRLTVARYFTPLGRAIQKPYANGQAAYKKEIMDRIHAGNDSVFLSDTTAKKVFVTRKGKKLFESGGITPDVKAVNEGNRMTMSLVRLFNPTLMNPLVFSLFRNNQKVLASSKNIASFDSAFKYNPLVDKTFEAISTGDSISYSKFSPAEKKLAETRIKALLARYRWRNAGYFEIMNRHDSVISKAIEIL